MVSRRRIFGDFLGPAFAASRVQHISDLRSKLALGPLCGSMVDIQSATAKIRRAKKERRKKKEKEELECGPMPNLMVALKIHIGKTFSTIPMSLHLPSVL